jgi:hypothetical protein
MQLKTIINFDIILPHRRSDKETVKAESKSTHNEVHNTAVTTLKSVLLSQIPKMVQ